MGGISVKRKSNHIDFHLSGRLIRLNKNHVDYSFDIIQGFNYYFESVEPYRNGRFEIVDFSQPRFHHVLGFDLMPIHFPSLAEPLSTTDQYTQFANLKLGDCVLDLGAYSGLTSIFFKEIVGGKGRVIAVEVDPENLKSMKTNFDLYRKVTGMCIESIEEAIWSHSEGVRFSASGNMGSSASPISEGEERGDLGIVRSTTLSGVVKKLGLERIDFVKCDIEGAESVIFEDSDFFSKFRPRIIVETHYVRGQLSTEKVMSDLARYNYSFNVVSQPGVSYPLIECVPA
jgi:FkbM family methyltransferase